MDLQRVEVLHALEDIFFEIAHVMKAPRGRNAAESGAAAQRHQIVFQVEELQLAAGIGGEREDAHPQSGTPLRVTALDLPRPGCHLSADETPLIRSTDNTGPTQQV